MSAITDDDISRLLVAALQALPSEIEIESLLGAVCEALHKTKGLSALGKLADAADNIWLTEACAEVHRRYPRIRYLSATYESSYRSFQGVCVAFTRLAITLVDGETLELCPLLGELLSSPCYEDIAAQYPDDGDAARDAFTHWFVDKLGGDPDSTTFAVLESLHDRLRDIADTAHERYYAMCCPFDVPIHPDAESSEAV